MKVEKLTNGQHVVTHENLELTQTIINGQKYNECTVKHESYTEIVPPHDERFKPLFIALYQYKYN